MNSGNKEWGNLSMSLEFFCERKFALDSKVLDVGCYTGSLIYRLFQRGFSEVYGIDVDQRSVRRGQELHPELKTRIISYDGKHLPFPDAFFDVVTMFDVLEHIIDLEQFLEKQVKRVLKPGGMLVFQTPNKYTNIPWEILIHRSFTKYKSYHMSLQSYSSLKHVLHNCGFRDIVISKRDIMQPYYLQPLRRYLGIMASPIAVFFNSLPPRFATNFWGHCEKLSGK